MVLTNKTKKSSLKVIKNTFSAKDINPGKDLLPLYAILAGHT
jgi:hypothetical protein